MTNNYKFTLYRIFNFFLNQSLNQLNSTWKLEEELLKSNFLFQICEKELEIARICQWDLVLFDIIFQFQFSRQDFSINP